MRKTAANVFHSYEQIEATENKTKIPPPSLGRKGQGRAGNYKHWPALGGRQDPGDGAEE